MKVVLREVGDSDLPIFYEHQRGPEAVRMAAFASRDHDAFITHWAKLRREPSNIARTIVCDGQVAGNIGSWIAQAMSLRCLSLIIDSFHDSIEWKVHENA